MELLADVLDVLRLMIRPLFLGLVLIGIWLGLERAKFERREHLTTWLMLAVPLVTWFLVNWYLVQNGFFRSNAPAIFGSSTSFPVPRLPFAVIIPVAVGLTLMLRSERMGRLIDAIPSMWLMGYQTTRIIGGVFLIRWAQGQLPGEFALPAGIGDVLTGLFALPAAFYLTRGGSQGRAAAYAWNFFGIADLFVALTLGALTSPSRFQLLALDHPNQVTFDPSLAVIPTFAVPLALILHGLMLWKLSRMTRRDAAPGKMLEVSA